MRFKELVESDMTQAQRAVHAEICAGPRGRMGPPTNVLLRCPELANHSQKIGEYVRFGSTLPSRIMEFVIIMAARHWDAHYAWNSHCPLAIKAGLSPEVASELAKGKRPAGMKDDEAAAYDFCTELHNTKQVGDATFEAALKQFGEAGIVDLMGGSAYYTLICMSLKVNKKTLPEGVPLPWPLSK
jgi:4-carboxymuconolactone decarboxylase